MSSPTIHSPLGSAMRPSTRFQGSTFGSVEPFQNRYSVAEPPSRSPSVTQVLPTGYVPPALNTAPPVPATGATLPAAWKSVQPAGAPGCRPGDAKRLCRPIFDGPSRSWQSTHLDCPA